MIVDNVRRRCASHRDTEARFERMADQVRVLGPDHPNTLTARHNLVHWREHHKNPKS